MEKKINFTLLLARFGKNLVKHHRATGRWHISSAASHSTKEASSCCYMAKLAVKIWLVRFEFDGLTVRTIHFPSCFFFFFNGLYLFKCFPLALHQVGIWNKSSESGRHSVSEWQNKAPGTNLGSEAHFTSWPNCGTPNHMMHRGPKNLINTNWERSSERIFIKSLVKTKTLIF